MNKKVRGILLGGIKGLLVITIAISFWMILTPYFRVNRNKEGDYFRNIPDNTIDVIGLGLAICNMLLILQLSMKKMAIMLIT